MASQGYYFESVKNWLNFQENPKSELWTKELIISALTGYKNNLHEQYEVWNFTYPQDSIFETFIFSFAIKMTSEDDHEKHRWINIVFPKYVNDWFMFVRSNKFQKESISDANYGRFYGFYKTTAESKSLQIILRKKANQMQDINRRKPFDWYTKKLNEHLENLLQKHPDVETSEPFCQLYQLAEKMQYDGYFNFGIDFNVSKEVFLKKMIKIPKISECIVDLEEDQEPMQSEDVLTQEDIEKKTNYVSWAQLQKIENDYLQEEKLKIIEKTMENIVLENSNDLPID